MRVIGARALPVVPRTACRRLRGSQTSHQLSRWYRCPAHAQLLQFKGGGGGGGG